jgi:hypothetical protein
MTREDMTRLAREAGLTIGTNMSGIGLVGSPADIGIAHITLDQMHHFADIVAAAERNRTWTQDHWTEYERSIVATEREAIATEFMKRHEAVKHLNNYWHHAAVYVRKRG